MLILVFCTLITCIDPFKPNLKGTTSILIIDALLTNENKAHAFKLSWTTQTQSTSPEMVTGASVTLSDNLGSVMTLTETSPGIYKTDSINFHAETGNSYVLGITTSDGTEYLSDTCKMYPVQPIDKIYFTREQEFINNGTDVQEGIRVFIDSENSGDGKYFRWTYDEYWKFKVPQPKKYEYIREEDIRPVDQVKEICYAYNGSDETNIRSTASATSSRIEKQPILFIPSDQSDRLLIQYYIEVNQLSLSKTEFEFWDHMKEINESGGDIFDKQPFSIPSNIHNKTNPSDLVLGYFQVSSVESKSIYILPDDIASFNLPVYEYPCDRIERGPDDYFDRRSFDKIYASFAGSSYIFIEPVYDLRWNLIKLAFAKRYCAICTVNGSLTKPDFWIDME